MKKPLKSIALILAAIAFALIPVSCSEDHDHDHDHGHDDEHEHGDHDEKGHHDEKDKDHDHAEKGDEQAHAEDDDHGHEHAGIEAGPNGGRLLTVVEPHLEFLVTADRKVQIAAVNEEDKAQPIGEQVVSVIGGDRSSPTRMKFAKNGDVLLSDIAFPDGNDFPVVVQIKDAPGGETITEKFNLNLEECPTCENREYACTCDHEH